MKNKISKILVCNLLAGTFAAAGLLGACAQNGYDETGTTVKFEYNDGKSRPYTVVAEENGKVIEPAVPEREGYEFSYWQTQSDGGDKIEFPYTPANDVTLYAHWEEKTYTVTFDYTDSGIDSIVEKIKYNTTVDKPADPEWEGHTFYKWITKNGDDVSFPYTVKKDVTFFAYWSIGDLLTVNIDLNYESAPEQDGFKLADGEKITAKMLTNPTRTHYKFNGWSESPDGNIIKLPYTPKQSCTLYAQWERKTYGVAFRYNFTKTGTAIYETQSVLGGDSVNAPKTDPVRSDEYTFDGWYTSATGGEKITFPYTPTEECSIYAHWKHIPVETDIFQAEYTYFNPLEQFPGYSGEAYGTKVILASDTGGVYVDDVTGSINASAKGYYVTYMYKQNATITFEIESTAAVSGVTLKVNLAAEFDPRLSIGPTGDNAYEFRVNGVPLNYNTIAFNGSGDKDMSYKSNFQEFTISTNVTLKEGANVIELVTANNNAAAMGGTMKAVAPMIDYIKLENYGSAKLSWCPIYDNIAGK